MHASTLSYQTSCYQRMLSSDIYTLYTWLVYLVETHSPETLAGSLAFTWSCAMRSRRWEQRGSDCPSLLQSLTFSSRTVSRNWANYSKFRENRGLKVSKVAVATPKWKQTSAGIERFAADLLTLLVATDKIQLEAFAADISNQRCSPDISWLFFCLSRSFVLNVVWYTNDVGLLYSLKLLDYNCGISTPPADIDTWPEWS